VSRLDNPFTWAAELIDKGYSAQDALRMVAYQVTLTYEHYGAIGDDVKDDTAAIQSAWDDGVFCAPREEKTYKITDTLKLPTGDTFGYVVCGAGMEQTKFHCVGMTGKPGIAKEEPGEYLRCTLRDFGVYGDCDSAIDLDGTGVFWTFQSMFENLDLISAGSDAFKCNLQFNCLWTNVHVSSTSGHGFNLLGGPSTTLQNCYAHNVTGSGKAGYRIHSGATLINCNGLDSGETWGYFGADTTEGDPANQQFNISMIGCNIEAFTVRGLNCRFNGWLYTNNCTYLTAPTGTFDEYIRVAFSDQGIFLFNSRVDAGGAVRQSSSNIVTEGSANIIDMSGDWPDYYRVSLATVITMPSMGTLLIDSTLKSLNIPYLSGINVSNNTTWTADSATFSVAGIDRVKTANTVATTFTAATGGRGGQGLRIQVKDSNTTIAHNSGIGGQFILSRASNYTCIDGDVLEFAYDAVNGVWREISVSGRAFIVASSVTDNVGVQTPVGTLSDTQTALDGNEWNMPENNSNPAIDVDFGFTGIRRIHGVVFNARYTGLASHYITVAIRDYTAGVDRNLMNFSTTASNNYRTVLIPDDTNFIDGSGNAQISFHHSPVSGNTSHDLYVEYIALLV